MTQSQRELDRLLARMRDESPPDFTADDEAAREERMAARIDEVIQEPDMAPIAPIASGRARSSMRRVALLLLAACFPIALFVAMRARRGEGTAWIARDRDTAPIAHAPTPDERTVPIETAPPSEPKPSKAAGSARTALPAHAPSTKTAEPPAATIEAPSAEAARSTLSEENRLFQDAAQAERAGDAPRAIATLDRLVHDFPRSPLVQNAMVRKFRLLARAGRKAEAAAAAREYLVAFPLGFAKPEAEGIANDPAAP